MGKRKKEASALRKEENKNRYWAKLANHPTSPRKMRLVADVIRGMDADKALDVLQFTSKAAATPMSKLLRSAIANFEQKSGLRADESNLYVKTVFVDSGRVLKRVQPAPQGRAHRVRKRSNHVTIEVGMKSAEVTATETVNS
jgi:large subunit ribosomal protein L22